MKKQKSDRERSLCIVKCSWKLHQVDVSVPDFCPGVAEARLGLLGREGVPGNAAAESKLRVLWINGTQTCKGSPASRKYQISLQNIPHWAAGHKSELLGV